MSSLPPPPDPRSAPPPPAPPRPGVYGPPPAGYAWAGAARWYRLDGPAKALRVLVVLVAVAGALAVPAVYNALGVLEDFVDGTASENDLLAAVGVFVVVAFLTSGVQVAAAVLTMVWMYRLAKNHQALGRPGTTWGPGWAIGGWFIPLANLVIPFLMFRELWKGSDPGLTPNDPSWKYGAVAGVVAGWWAMWVISFVLDVFAQVAAPGEDTDTLAGAVDEFSTIAGSVAVAAVTTSIAAVLYWMVIRQLTERQNRAVATASGAAPTVQPF